MLECIQDLVILGVLLMSKLVAREPQDNKLISKFVDQLVHLGIIPHSRISERSDIHHQDHFSFIRGEINFLSSQSCGMEVKKILYLNWASDSKGRHVSILFLLIEIWCIYILTV